jgi:TRAP-type C4-dicarboxylate transport system permease small subunit
MRRVRRLFDAIERVLTIALGACMAVMTLTLIVSVILRYVFSSSMDSGWEIARLTFVSAIMLGIPLALRRGLHVGIDLSRSMQDGPLKRALHVLREVLVAALFVVIIQKALILHEISADEMLNTIDVSKNVFYKAQIFACVVTVAFCIERVILLFGGLGLSRGDGDRELA